MSEGCCSNYTFAPENWTYDEKRYFIFGVIDCVINVALVIIGSLSISGHLTGVQAGFAAIGLGIGTSICVLSLGDLKEKKPDLIVTLLHTVALVILGTLACKGMLSAKQIGIGLVAATPAGYLAVGLTYYLLERRNTKK